MAFPYKHGLVPLRDHAYAYLQPDGGWGWSNAGLITGRSEALLIDTLFDVPLTRRMLAAMQPHLRGPIRKVVNTHHNGDHCWGNQLLPEATIIAHRACREHLLQFPPRLLIDFLAQTPPSPGVRYAREVFAPFDFGSIEVTPPTVVFDTQLTLYVDDQQVELLYVGPAHTAGDLIVHVPAAGIAYAGDILFRYCTPVIWSGPTAQWIAALDRILALEGVEIIVPGHGPLCDKNGVREMREYLLYAREAARACFERGLSPQQAARAIDLGPYRDWGEWERLAINVERFYREFRGDTSPPSLDRNELFTAMAELREGFNSTGPAGAPREGNAQ